MTFEPRSELYRKLLRPVVNGDALWTPTEAGWIGDCGYIDDDGIFVTVRRLSRFCRLH